MPHIAAATGLRTRTAPGLRRAFGMVVFRVVVWGSSSPTAHLPISIVLGASGGQTIVAGDCLGETEQPAEDLQIAECAGQPRPEHSGRWQQSGRVGKIGGGSHGVGTLDWTVPGS